MGAGCQVKPAEVTTVAAVAPQAVEAYEVPETLTFKDLMFFLWKKDVNSEQVRTVLDASKSMDELAAEKVVLERRQEEIRSAFKKANVDPDTYQDNVDKAKLRVANDNEMIAMYNEQLVEQKAKLARTTSAKVKAKIQVKIDEIGVKLVNYKEGLA